MTMMLLRRRKLGYGSCVGMSQLSPHIDWVRNDRIDSKDWEGVTTLIRWGCTSVVNRPHLTQVNTSAAIHQVNDKAGFRMEVQDRQTEKLVPYSFLSTDDSQYPAIVRPNTHSRGLHFFPVHNEAQYETAWRTIREDLGVGWYGQEVIPKVREYRVYIVCGRVVCVAEKMVEDRTQLAWNRARTACEFVNVRWGDWPLEGVRKAIEVFNMSFLDFGGVDVIESEDGEFYVLEINSAPSLPMYEGVPSYRQKCFARAFDWHYNENDWDRIGVFHDLGWHGYIHPGVQSDAV